MNIIALIIKREYLSRVRKKSFIIMTLLGPILMGALIIGPTYLASRSNDDDTKVIAVLDNAQNRFEEKLGNSKNIQFVYIKNKAIKDFYKEFVQKGGFYGYLYNSDAKNYSLDSISFVSEQQISLQVKSYISGQISKKIEHEKLQQLGIDEAKLNSAKTEINLKTLRMGHNGSTQKSSSELITAIAYLGPFLIYMFILLYGVQIMRGVLEEKTSRIVEVIISSVKPFQLMMGKILGIALVALTQFGTWTALTSAIFFASRIGMADNKAATDIFEMVSSVPWTSFVICFLFYFIGGYLLYGALLAAIGSAADNETDTQQFMMPVTLPLIVSFIMLQPVLSNPTGSLAYWMSLFPFTSPVVMLARVPFGVPWYELALSMLFLAASFVCLTWIAAKIYRTGILMYGKKVSYSELWKWLRYRD